MNTEESRKQFEEWMINTAKIKIGSRDPYPSGLERDYWIVWQASRENIPKIKLPTHSIGECSMYKQSRNQAIDECKCVILEAVYEVDDD